MSLDVVSSEVNQDQFLDCLSAKVFNDSDDDDGESEEGSAHISTVFETTTTASTTESVSITIG